MKREKDKKMLFHDVPNWFYLILFHTVILFNPLLLDQLPERFSEALETEEQKKRPRAAVAVAMASDEPIAADLRHVEEQQSAAVKTKQVPWYFKTLYT